MLLVGRLSDLKGGRLLIEAMHHASKSLSEPLRLLVAGDGPERTLLEALAKRNITDLAALEREVFEYSIGAGGTLVPKNLKYWDLQPDGSVPVYVRGH